MLTPIVERLEGGRESVEELWTSLKNTIHEVAKETIGQRPATPRGHIYASERAKLLSEHQRLLRTDIQAAHDPDTATMLRGRRKETLKQLHRQLREDAIAYWNDKVKDVVQVKDDLRWLYPTLKCMARMCKGTQRKDDLSIDGVMIADETTKAATFRRHFEEAYTPQTDRPNATSQLLEGSNFRLDIDQVQKAVKSQSMRGQLVFVAYPVSFTGLGAQICTDACCCCST